MFIRISLTPTFFSKSPRTALINLERLQRCTLEYKKIHMYLGDTSALGQTFPFIVYYDTHTEAHEQFTAIEELLVKKLSKQERWDMASPDPLAVVAVQDTQQLK